MKRVIALAVLGALVISHAAAPRAQTAKTFKGRLSPVPIDQAMTASITGSGSVTAVLSGTRLSITGTFEGMRTAATLARLHRSPNKGIRGPVVSDLKVTGGTSGTISGSFDLTPAQIEELGKERFYVQVHSEKAPDGNLWGWLLSQESRR